MSNVTVTLSGGAIDTLTVVTDAAGTYTFNDVPSGDDYTIHLEKDGFVLDGVSTYDLVLITQAILDPSLGDPFFWLAADVNNTGTVTTLDVVLLREVILWLEDALAVGPWRFATEDFDFGSTGHVDLVPVENLQSDLTVNFIGVHIGDVNGSASTTDCN